SLAQARNLSAIPTPKKLPNPPIPMKTPNIVNTIVDEANRRTYVILAPRLLTDGEIYRAIRQELLRRGSPLADGETLTLTVTSNGGTVSSVAEPDPQKGLVSAAAPTPIDNEAESFASPPAPLE
ncbi:MAG: hypothetical protein ACREIC_09135, partial [Limisphaerales bacterium]